MNERNWILGDDLRPEDNLMDGITFDEIILTVHCNCRNITRETVIREVNDLVSMRLDDMRELLMHNIDIIMSEAKKGRGDYENS